MLWWDLHGAIDGKEKKKETEDPNAGCQEGR